MCVSATFLFCTFSFQRNKEVLRACFSDYSSAEVTPSSPDRSFVLQKLKSASDEEDDTDEDTSSLDDDSEMTHNLLGSGSKEDVREEITHVGVVAPGDGGGKKGGRGILGYLAMLERQAKDRVTHVDTPDSPDDGLGARSPDEPDSCTAVLSGEESAPNGK